MTAGSARERAEVVLEELRARADPTARDGMARFGIRGANVLGGSSIPHLRATAKRLGRDHPLALSLWDSGIHEARLLACFVDDPAKVTEEQMEEWAAGFDSWDVVDQCCGNLFDRTAFAWPKAREWCGRDEEFSKRAGFSLMAQLAVHDKASRDERFLELLALVEREAGDPRNLVRKAVNWALRQIGKRNLRLNRAAVRTAHRILAGGERSARWVANDALRELTSLAVRARLGPAPGRRGEGDRVGRPES